MNTYLFIMYAPPEADSPLCLARIENRAMLVAAAQAALTEAESRPDQKEVGRLRNLFTVLIPELRPEPALIM